MLDHIVSADLNRDGTPDLVVATHSPAGVAGVWIFLGDGQGGFTLSAALALGLGVTTAEIAVGDLNGDGVPDIVAVPEQVAAPGTGTLNDAAMSVLLGRGDGTFQPAVSVPLPLPPEASQVALSSVQGVAIGDVTGDGKPDVVIDDVAINDQGLANPNGTLTSYGALVLPGAGDGTFGTGYFTGNNDTGGAAKDQSGAFALADLNGDGLLDLVTAGGHRW